MIHSATCDRCIYGISQDQAPGYVECRRYPPTVHIVEDDGGMKVATSQYPHCDILKPCGEFAENIQSKIAGAAPITSFPNFQAHSINAA